MRVEVMGPVLLVVMLTMATAPTTVAEGDEEERVILGPFSFAAASDECAFRLAGVAPGIDLEGVLGDDCATASNGTWTAECIPYHCAMYVDGVAHATREAGLWTDSVEVLGVVSTADNFGEGKRSHYGDSVCNNRTAGDEVSCAMDVESGPLVYYLVTVHPGSCGEVGWGSVARAQRADDVRTQFAASALDLFEVCHGTDGTWMVTDI